jgi:intracellular sulfur oxidation DsrE/DsrF family protein
MLSTMTKRREFLTSLTLAAATIALDTDEVRAEATAGAWDTSWIDSVAKAKYRVVFNGSDIADGLVLDYTSTFFEHFREVHDTRDADTRPVIVFRRLGTVMALNDAMWERYAIGADRKVDDPLTKAPARRNPFWSAPAGDKNAGPSIESLQKRGLICLACNVSLMSMGYSFAQKTGRAVDEVRKELRENLVPGGIAVPSGIYALIRAQNAGCAFMQGT